MSVTVARDTIVCPRCQSQRIVSLRQRRRAVSEGLGLCSTCRGVRDTRPFKDEHLSYWLDRYNAPCPQGQTPSEFIAAGGCPPELKELAMDCYPEG